MDRRTFGQLAFCAIIATASRVEAQEATSWTVNGVIRELHPERRSITIRHEAIPGLMGAMTMPFRVASLSLLEGLEVGQRIRFTMVRAADRRLEIRSIQRR